MGLEVPRKRKKRFHLVNSITSLTFRAISGLSRSWHFPKAAVRVIGTRYAALRRPRVPNRALLISIFASGWSIDSAYLSRSSTSTIGFANQAYMTAHTYSALADKVGEVPIFRPWPSAPKVKDEDSSNLFPGCLRRGLSSCKVRIPQILESFKKARG